MNIFIWRMLNKWCLFGTHNQAMFNKCSLLNIEDLLMCNKSFMMSVVDLEMFNNSAMGELVKISGSDPILGSWTHKAFIPIPLSGEEPPLSAQTYREVAAAGRELASLDATARQLPQPYLLRLPSLRTEAQATSALEGTYAPLDAVLTANEAAPTSVEMREVLNYVTMAETGYAWVEEGRPITLGLLEDLQGTLMRGTPLEEESGHLREGQVVIGRRDLPDPHDPAIKGSRFVPPPPGDRLRAGVESLLAWIERDHSGKIDPVIEAGMAHYQFETLHPFRDGNGRLGRYLIVLTLLRNHLLSEPTLTVSPWFEARRGEYYDRLLAVSTEGDWDSFLSFFARGLAHSARSTRELMLALADVQRRLKETVSASKLRSAKALELVDFAVAHPSFTAKMVQRAVGLSYSRTNNLIGQFVDLRILEAHEGEGNQRVFWAPEVLRILLTGRNR